MTATKHDPFADTLVLPQDELAVRRMQKQLRRLAPAQIQRLVAAFEQREKATPSAQRRTEPPRLIEDQPDSWPTLLPVPEEFPIG